jgi:uncharacterized protein YPO0396
VERLLFGDNGRPQGFRLKAFELYNWGSFDGRVYRLAAEGETTLLTGANGSGKTTLVDALVTLLVPPVKRHYNQSSGGDLKRERTESSYFHGAYGTIREEERFNASTQRLRDRSAYSILLGVFVNTGTLAGGPGAAGPDGLGTVTLGQVRWFTGDNLQRSYFVLHGEASIAGVLPVDKPGEWKKRLKDSHRGQFFDSFNLYAQYFSGLFGFRSEKALTLFSQTVGVKVLGNLNEFIRTQMLEERNFEVEFDKLKKNFEDLLASHLEIEKARDQLELLKPVLEHGRRFRNLSAALERLGELLEALPGVFAREARRCLLEAVERRERELSEASAALEAVQRELERLEAERDAILQARNTDSTAVRLQQLDLAAQRQEELRLERRAVLENYVRFAATVGVREPRTEEGFRRNREKAAAVREETAARIRELEEAIFTLRKRSDAGREELAELRREVECLQGRRSNIPRLNLELRVRLAEALELAETELPFAGELLRVRPEQAEWQPAIERLLHHFALCVLVPEEHYRRVNAYVRDTDLRGRLVYFRVPPEFRRLRMRDLEAGSVAAKLEVKPGTPLREWLEDYLEANFDHVCTDDLEDFARLSRGLTRSGLIKNEARHEKDDRPRAADRERWVLGWDNLEKLKALGRQARELDGRLAADGAELARLDGEREAARSRQEAAGRILEQAEYERLDWRACAEELGRLKEERRELVGSSERLRTLEDQQKKVERKRERAEADRDRLNRQLQSLEEGLEADRRELAVREEVLRAYAHVDPDRHLAGLLERMSRPFPLPGPREVEEERARTLERLQQEKEGSARRQADAQRQLEKAMQGYCQPPAQIAGRYPGWSAEVIDLRPEAAYLDEFTRLHDRIRKEDLPRFRRRFKEYLNDRMLENLVSFNESLHHSLAEIEAGVAEINSSLAQIRYSRNPPTFIELEARPAADVAVRDFRLSLRGTIADAGRIARQDEAEMEHTFGGIKRFIEALEADVNWRRRVLDVRNWLQFAAVERYVADRQQKQYYEDSQSLSGGEKAKLAYTILASAIAFQFGMCDEGSRTRSFRFVIVDEAFSKVDPDNAAYAMELFRTLELQLMVVTPLDKINVVEDYVKAVHFVENRDRRRSAVYNLSLEEYRARKEENGREPAPDTPAPLESAP